MGLARPEVKAGVNWADYGECVMGNVELERAANALGYQLIREPDGNLSLYDDECVEEAGTDSASIMCTWLLENARSRAKYHEDSLKYHAENLDRVRRAKAILEAMRL